MGGITIINKYEIPKKIQYALGKIEQIQDLEQGCTSDVAIIRGTQGVYVIKRATGQWHKSLLKKEANIMKKLSRSKVKSPQIFVEHEDENYSWVLMEYIRGESLRKAMSKTDSKEQRYKMLFHYGEMLMKIHSEDYPIGNREIPWIDQMLQEAEYNLLHYETEGNEQLLNHLKKISQSLLERP